jgi:tRNA dimethylallyltransferase
VCGILFTAFCRLMIAKVHRAGSFPIVVGGTGLYLASLTQGIAAVPSIPSEIRQQARQLWSCLGPDGFYKELEAIDPLGARHLCPRDQQRLVRAYEVKKATQISLFEWRQVPDVAIQHLRPRMLVLLPPRSSIYENAERRLLGMLNEGVLKEIKKFADRLPDPSLPLTKALGFRPLRAYIEGQLSYEDALARTLYDTRHYIKRQYTWFRHQALHADFLDAFPSEAEIDKLITRLTMVQK